MPVRRTLRLMFVTVAKRRARNMQPIVRNSFWEEIHSRKLTQGGVLPPGYAVDLIETLHHLEANPGLTHGELEKAARKSGALVMEMKWRLACLALIGLAKTGSERNGCPTWFANAESEALT
jgi:hypothetical protein